MLGLLDPAATDPAGHARAATATDFEQLAQRYTALHATADPAALLTPVAAHIRMATAALGRDNTASDRRRLLRNLTVAATLAARLASEDLGHSRIRTGNGPAVMATLRNFALSRHRLGGHTNIAAACRHTSRHPIRAADLLK